MMGLHGKEWSYLLFFLFTLSAVVVGQESFITSVSVDLTNIDRCRNLSVSGTLVAQVNTSSNCFGFSADHIVLDCNDFTIHGTERTGTAINVTNRKNITIKDCFITDFFIGMHLNNATNFTQNDIDTNETNISTEIVSASSLSHGSWKNTTIETNQSVTFNNVSFSNSTIKLNNNNNNTLVNVTFSNGSRIFVTNAGITITDSLVGEYNFSSANVSIVRTNEVELNFTTPITGANGGNLTSLITITNESVRVNSMIAPHLNVSAKIVFFPQNLNNLEAKVDLEDDGTFVTCPTDLCENESTVGDRFIFDAVHFTGFGFGQAGPGGGAGPGAGPGAAAAGGGGGGAPPKIPADLEIIPESIEKSIKAGETKQFVIEIKNGLQKREVNVFLDAPDFVYINNKLRQFSLSLPAGDTWRILLTVDMPKNALGVYEGKLVVKGVNLEKTVSIKMVSGSGMVFVEDEEEGEDEPLLEEVLAKKNVEKPSKLPQKSHKEARTVEEGKQSSTMLKTALLSVIIIALVTVITLVAWYNPQARRTFIMVARRGKDHIDAVSEMFVRKKPQRHKRHLLHRIIHRHSDKESQIQVYTNSQPQRIIPVQVKAPISPVKPEEKKSAPLQQTSPQPTAPPVLNQNNPPLQKPIVVSGETKEHITEERRKMRLHTGLSHKERKSIIDHQH